MSIKVIKSLESNIKNESLYKVVDASALKTVNNYFEVVFNQPARLYIDLDGELSEKAIKECDKKEFTELNDVILNSLITLKDTSIMESSSYESNKLSYRITWINEYCNDLNSVKEIILNEKYNELKELMKNIIKITKESKKIPDELNIDIKVYRIGKMRCVNAYKTNDDKTRINKLIKGEIIDTFIHHIPDSAVEKKLKPKVKLEVKEELKEESKKIEDVKTPNVGILQDIERKVLKIGKGHYDSYNEWLELCFIIYNESNNSYEGKELFLKLCEKVCSNFNKQECERKWYSIKQKEGKKLTIGTLNKKYYELYPEEKPKIKLDPHLLGDLNDKYTLEKIKFEQRIFKLDNPFYYVKINSDKSLEFFEEAKLSKWAKGQYKKISIKMEEHVKEYNFVDLWLDDANKRSYDKIIFNPQLLDSKESKDYNCWTGFNHSIDSNLVFDEANSLFLKLLKRITNDDIIHEYLKQWIAHIIQKPWLKTKVGVVLYSDTKGVGKNALIDGIIKLLEGYTAKIESIEDITRNFNSHLVNKLLIVGDEICAKAQGVSDKLKETITRTVQNLEKKGVDPIPMDDYTNWIFTTNNFNAFTIEQGDRRMFMINCLEEKFIESIEYYKEINNDKLMNDLFNYFLTYKVTYKFGEGEKIPLTKYKEELQYNSKPGYIQMLYKQPYHFSGCNFTPTEFMKLTNDYCKTNYLKQTSNVVIFGKTMSVIFKDYKKRSKTSYIYKFETINTLQFNKILYEYDKDYFKYINNLDEKDEPDFTEDKTKNFKQESTNDLDA